MPKNHIEEFTNLIHDIITSKEFQKMKEYKHHRNSTTYRHSLHVAYLCYLYYKRKQRNVNIQELIRSALLHDYFLYDWRENDGKCKGLVHGFVHAKRALENALKDYPDLTKVEQDAIKNHMFPLTLVPPTTKCGWVICYYDKVAAISEYMQSKRIILA